jgi:hypothetical protein
MKNAPKAVIYINFLAGQLLFDPRHIWSALIRARDSGKVSQAAFDQIHTDLDQMAIYLGHRDYMLRAAVKQLKLSLTTLADLIPEPWSLPSQHGYGVVGNAQIFAERDRALLAFDSALFEFRSYLELLATFIYRFLVGAGNPPISKVKHSSGDELEVVNKQGKLKTHNFLRHLCDELSCTEDWYVFLSKHRNFFTHNGAPNVAIEDLLVRPPDFEFLIMRTNIHKFEHADPSDYFRLSELQGVVDGVRTLAGAAEEKLVALLDG